MPATGQGRHFLLLQGPHGPFFRQLGQMLTATGARVWRVGFNGGDAVMWGDRQSYIPFLDAGEVWPTTCAAILAERGITDLVLYGDTRPIHAQAIAIAREQGLCVHVFEEGYLRPYWVTYERGGSNGHSRLMQMPLAKMRAALASLDMDVPDAPSHWGDMRQHVFWGAIYHWWVMTHSRAYRGYHPHRDLTVRQEFTLYLKRVLAMPFHRWERMLAQARIRQGGFPYHLVLLQLEHDASFRRHSPFRTITEFIDLVMSDFAAGAPRHHHLVLKAHPLEDGRVPVAHEIRRLARQHGLTGRVHFVRGGKLAALLNDARSAVTVNSTAGQQVLWRGLPLRTFGAAVYAKPEFVSTQPLVEFFSRPVRPDSRAYRDFRQFLLETSQVPGGFYAQRGRRALLRQVVDMMLAAKDPYDELVLRNAAPRQQLRLIP
jgi:capsular polysaccharide export protein